MKTLKTVKLKFLISITLFFCYSIFKSQTINNFYATKDTITFKKPIIISFKESYGLFIVEESVFSSNKNIKKLVQNNKAYLYGDGIGFISQKERKVYNMKIGDCEIARDKVENTYTTFLLPNHVLKFYLAFTTTENYNKVMSNPHQRKSFIKNEKEFKPILFPICD